MNNYLTNDLLKTSSESKKMTPLEKYIELQREKALLTPSQTPQDALYSDLARIMGALR